MESQIVYAIVAGLVVAGLAISKRTSSEVRAVQRYARARGIAMVRPWEFQMVRRHVVVRVCAVVRSHVESATEVTASVVVPSGLVLDYVAHGAWPLAIPGTAEAWATICEGRPRALAGCNGRATLVRIPDVAVGDDVLDAMVELATLLARWDDGLTDVLLALPGAAALEEHELNPGAVLAPDDLMIGIRGGAETVAQIAGGDLAEFAASVTDGAVTTDDELPAMVAVRLRDVGTAELLVVASGARLTWPHVERDPARLRAGVDVLRAIAGGAGPYR